MRTIALILSVLLAFPASAFAGDVVPVVKGQPAPDEGVFMDLAKAAQVAADHKRCEVERDGYKSELEKPKVIVGEPNSLILPIVGVTVSAAVIGGLGGFFLARQIYKK